MSHVTGILPCHLIKIQGCRVLITSRRASWDAALGITTLTLDVLPRIDSIALLRTFLPDLAANDPDLDAIAAELGDLPLALHLAGSFLADYRYRVTPAEYLTQLRQPDLLAHPSLQGRQLTRDLSPTRHDQHVARTFALSYERLDPNDPTDTLARALLVRAAYFAPGQPIPRDLLLATVMWPTEASDAALQAEDTLRRLLDLGLLESEAGEAVRLHRLLAVFGPPRACDAAAQTAVEDALLAEVDRLASAGYPGPLLTLHPHLQAVTEDARLREDAQAARLETMLGHSLRQLSDYAGAQAVYERALALHEQLFGPDHLAVAGSLNNLAVLYHAQERYAEAEPLYQRALATRERVLGPEHPDVATSCNNLAELYRAQGRYGEAEPLYQRALALRERILGPNHPDTATVRENYAILLRHRPREAVPSPSLGQRIRAWLSRR
jgi:tetratricopeptide (TPR) repeat protein